MSKKRKPPTMTDVLKKAIENCGESQYRIAKETGVKTTSLSRFMRGETSLRLDLADRIAAHLGLQLTQIPNGN